MWGQNDWQITHKKNSYVLWKNGNFLWPRPCVYGIYCTLNFFMLITFAYVLFVYFFIFICLFTLSIKKKSCIYIFNTVILKNYRIKLPLYWKITTMNQKKLHFFGGKKLHGLKNIFFIGLTFKIKITFSTYKSTFWVFSCPRQQRHDKHYYIQANKPWCIVPFPLQ